MKIKITRYLGAFNARGNKGAIQLSLANGQDIPLRDLAPDIFSAYMSVLSREPVYFDTQSGWVQTAFESPVDLD